MCVSDSFWSVPQVASWPVPPDKFSFSSIKDIELCPRRWSLLNADFSGLWDKKGYPLKPGKEALIGQVTHLALQMITKALVENCCSSINHESFFLTMRSLGGYSDVVKQAINSITGDLEPNPRFQKAKDYLLLELEKENQRIITNVKNALFAIQLHPRLSKLQDREKKAEGKPLGMGSYSEVLLEPSSLNWRGIADLINITTSEIEIVDFKAGKTKEDHTYQLYLYSLLWWRDEKRNPGATIPSKLTIVYKDGSQEIPALNTDELQNFQIALEEREGVALTLLKAKPPKAVPSLNSCCYCSAKQLCDDYWMMLPKNLDTHKDKDRLFRDVQINNIEPISSTSWLGKIMYSDFLKEGAKIFVRSDFNDLLTEKILEKSKSVRILSGIMNLKENQSDSFESIKISTVSEIYKLS